MTACNVGTRVFGTAFLGESGGAGGRGILYTRVIYLFQTLYLYSKPYILCARIIYLYSKPYIVKFKPRSQNPTEPCHDVAVSEQPDGREKGLLCVCRRP